MVRRAAALLLGVSLLAASAPHPIAADEPVTPIYDEVAQGDQPSVRLAFSATRYRTPIFASTTVATMTYAARPDLNTNQTVALGLDLYRPAGDSATSRPLLIWVHGGAFINGSRGSMRTESIAYARLGYVTATISYRLDPGSKCLLVQAGAFTGQQLVVERARCERAILAARDDAAAAVAYLRTNAATYGIDPTRIAMGGSSAGAITAIHVGAALNTAGNPPPADSRISAVLAMSGCNYVDGAIDSLDAPMAILASGGDPLVPFACSKTTYDAAAAAGVPVLSQFYTHEGAHAEALYGAHQAEIDRSWRLFLIDHLDLA